jgi:CBS domain-containing protein
MRVRDVMTTDVVSVSPDTPLKRVAALLVERRISGVPVVDSDNSVIGVVSEADFLAKEEAQPERRRHWYDFYLVDREAQDAHLDRINATTAGQAMTWPAITIGPDETLHHAADAMGRRGVNRLPVVDDGRLVGIVTRADIVRVFARSDSELRQRVEAAVRAVEGLTVVGVQNGVVELAGGVSSREVVATVRTVVLQIDGVVGVDDADVTWAELEEPVRR